MKPVSRTTNPPAARPVRPFDVVFAEIAETLARIAERLGEAKQLVGEINTGLDRAGFPPRKVTT